ncbi:transposase [Lactiplantibacillus plantarum]|uniref:transposase n=1 Tax=Lactiplantibacillus plantarum TaxID=1590 RepID=UPI001A1733C7|nr:transposase [Lactiplantibacillus plantarum]MBF9193691.1 transposase [Lactiplantibacillus plantarum]
MPPVMFSVVTKYHKGRHSLFLYNLEIFYAFTQDILRSPDGGYTGNNFAQSVQAMINAEVIIAKQSDLRHGQVTPQHWVIERSFSWLGKYRRLWRNCERKLNTSKMMISLAFLRILLKRF